MQEETEQEADGDAAAFAGGRLQSVESHGMAIMPDPAPECRLISRAGAFEATALCV
jgi:hypothetical protein